MTFPLGPAYPIPARLQNAAAPRDGKRRLAALGCLLILAAGLYCSPQVQAQTQGAETRPLPPASVIVKQARPLLMQGKHSLYQRILARPGAVLQTRPQASDQGKSVAPFRMFYVYARRQDIDGQTWLQVGSDTRGELAGWLPEQRTLEWNQALTVAFREPLGHDRVMLFRDKQSLKNLVLTHDLVGYRDLYRKASSGLADPDSPVVAIQPKAHVDIKDDFYLVPIKSHEDAFLGSSLARLLQVSSVPLAMPVNEPGSPEAVREASRDGSPADAAYRAGLVFVVDSTTSMGPYINRTRNVMEQVYQAIEAAGLKNSFQFGLVAYRDNLEAAPGLQYLTRTYVNLSEGADGETFLAKARQVTPSAISSKDFREDAYAGVREAVDGMNWQGINARYVLLITDAGPREGDDPLSKTGLHTDDLNRLARDKNINLWVMHLKTPISGADHDYAAEKYKRLSRYEDLGDFYYGVELGHVGEFGRVLQAITRQVTRQVSDAQLGIAARAAQASPDTPAFPAKPADDREDHHLQDDPQADSLRQFQKKVELLGYALRMRYLQKRRDDGGVPAVFDAWLVDRDFLEPERAGVDVRVLLTRDQLSDLHAVLRQVLETAEEGVLAPDTFLEELKSLAATISRDPAAVAGSTRTSGGEGNLADLGYMREYIEDLPYTGEVMNLSLQDWEDWPAKYQLQFIHRLENRINYYQALHDDTDLWVALDGGPITGDAVFPVLLDMLP